MNLKDLDKNPISTQTTTITGQLQKTKDIYSRQVEQSPEQFNLFYASTQPQNNA